MLGNMRRSVDETPIAPDWDAGQLNSTEELLEEARNGRMFILVDDENRENEGDIVIPAQFANAGVINFMARRACGLICLALTKARINQLSLPPMSRVNEEVHETAFTVSIEARAGVTTGISAQDRARTIAVAIDPECDHRDIVSPGHVFPLQAREGGTLVRAGHTEAAVDIARLCGLNPSGVICEIMNDDGTMARLPDLIAFGRRHGLKIGSIADLIAYRRRTELLVRRIEENVISYPETGEWNAIVFANTIEYIEHLALVKGRVNPSEPCLVRMHAVDLLDDITGGRHWIMLHNAMQAIAEAESGIVVLIRDGDPAALSKCLRKSGAAPASQRELRDYGIGAQILTSLGVRDMILMTNKVRLAVGIASHGLNIVGHRPFGAE